MAESVLGEEDLRLVPREPPAARVVEHSDPRAALMVARVVTGRAGTLPRAVVFGGSFGSTMIRFLAAHFSRAVSLWQNDVDPDVIVAERPTVVIQAWVGHHIGATLSCDAVAALGARDQQ